MSGNEFVDFSDLVGKTILNIEGCSKDSEEVIFTTNDGNYLMYHYQDCCESVSLEDVEGDISDLLGMEVVLAEESGGESVDKEWGSETWTFYRLATAKGFVVLRWYGSSNGYYSESVSFCKVRG